MEKMITYRHNVMGINSSEAFLGVKGGYNLGRRDVYFVRALGWGQVLAPADVIADIDRKMGLEMERKRLFYRRPERLVFFPSREEMNFYEEQFLALKSGKEIYVKNLKGNPAFGNALAFACRETLDKYRIIKRNVTESMEKNFAVKLLYWTDSVLGNALSGWDERKCYKVLADNVVKEQEYLFYYMLTLIGCDVLLFQSREDIRTADEIKNLSMELKLGGFCELPFPEYTPCESKKITEAEPEEKTVSKIQVEQVHRPELKPVLKTGPQVRMPERQRQERRVEDGREKSFEELALLASSIVMIAVYDREGEPIATGSGIMIGRDGYILTNNHVLSEGSFFTVRIENDDNSYRADQIIKYNHVLDLAVIRIDRVLDPLPVYSGPQKLVRGQKVVAIGSPLGLFNSVSDGIIAGFRVLDDVDMIQFTAPTSPGSSGGAVLNMYGEVIGISTAGAPGAQGINWAVGYEFINLFTQGFRNA